MSCFELEVYVELAPCIEDKFLAVFVVMGAMFSPHILH
jgi:hypothetical protein